MKLSSIQDCKLIDLPKIEFRAGNITPVESWKEIPFKVKRLFYIYDIPGGKTRGAHAHKLCHQFIVAASGSFDILVDDGADQKVVSLNQPYHGIYVPPTIWSSQLNFSSGSICLVFTSHFFDELDYLREYKDFKLLRNER